MNIVVRGEINHQVTFSQDFQDIQWNHQKKSLNVNKIMKIYLQFPPWAIVKASMLTKSNMFM